MGEYSLDVGKKVGDSMLLNGTMQDAFCKPKKGVYGGLMRFKLIHINNNHQWRSEYIYTLIFYLLFTSHGTIAYMGHSTKTTHLNTEPFKI